MSSNLAIIRRDWDQPIREYRGSLENPQTPLSYPAEWLLDICNGGRTDSGIRVSELTAFQCITFLSGVDLIASMAASQPWHTVERQINQHGRAVHRIAYEHAYYDLLNSEPNEEMTWQTFLYVYLAHMIVWPGAYAEIQRNYGGDATALWPRNPGKTRPVRLLSAQRLESVPWRPYPLTIPAGALVYKTTDGIAEDQAGSERIIPAEDMLHVPGISLDGRIGQSLVWLIRNALGAMLAMEKFGNRYFANFAKPGGILEMPAKLAPGDEAKSKNSWQESQGGENAHRVAMMPPGWKFTAISHNPQEAQTKEQREFVRTEIAAALHLPPRVVGDTSTKTRGSTEQENQEILDFALSPKINAVKQEFRRKLFPHPGVGRRPKNPFMLDCDTWGLVRGDSASREKYYASGKQWGYLSTNDIKAREKENPVDAPWAEEYWMPVNMTLATTPFSPGDAGATTEPAVRAYSRLFRDAYGRVVTRERRDLATFQACFGPICYALRDQFGAAASQEMRVKASPGAESERFISEYLGGLASRSAEWTAERAEEVCAAELGRAAKAIRMAVYREIAAEKAKEPILLQ
jgi:HK97 family phage portal protein